MSAETNNKKAGNDVQIVIADDHDLVRTSLRHMLDSVDGFAVVGEACSGEQVLEVVGQLAPHVVLMDVRMPGMDGIEATAKLQRHFPDVRVIALTACVTDPYPDRLLEAGAWGFLTKDTAFDEVVKGIREVAEGRHYVCRKIAQELALKPLRRKNGNQSPFDELSERELQVALMIVSCRSVQDIADQLNVSPKTVNTFRYRMFEKLGVDSDVALTLLAIRYRLFSPEDLQ